MSNEALRRRPGSRRRARGFTLLEVVVSFTIFALSFAAILQIFSNGARNAAVSQAYVVALGHAQSQLDRLGVEEVLEPGETSGVLDNGMAWRLRVELHEESLAEDSLLRAFTVQSSVRWRDGVRERDVTLSSLRIGGLE